ncbi:hypothetical protein C343_04125 [Cryptococcus neoformans C23]|uniref:DUF6534 domain-containing protein n=2 Tax=Cryptococcus neoformans TaxID=5207 RepID=A0A854Q8T2_CRYNE|nr:hypothetical protein CNAG_05693 [Cryptococcus neoformans var. grubii H99]AUB25877.1 hypothetical protein CKF44_05693 [Cryptococcus neoformans var. grubii]OWZ30427.1 hypothetical protein C347_04185 [Cryptococcus neoformans var. grubii AD2-60a]OWZ39312.1 hypothetical protein C353_04033 [Cryptococcus neoformans var. grubii AD1-83a]OWZ42200.1 hypothetical protein C343_04125 [Cryptococcus neoformans var. grubii C23]OWZ53183.1 hypothetical protein C368_04199 [Cryptococcus neoformans var. grubii 1|eukprot:XP_012050336.1 hypothetical protein CNAG_05693 [Cryptococcus neoformans var. grubii H99]
MSHYQYFQIRSGAAAPTEEEATALFAPERTFSLGCMFAQPIVDTFMAGIMFMQVVTYFTYQRSDKWWTKCIVIFASIISIIMTVYLWFFGQYLFVQNFGLFSPFLETDKLAWFPVLDTICSSGIQSYFAYRAYLLNRRNIFIPITILFLILTSFAATIAVKVIFGNANSLMEADKVRIPELIWLASIMAADILITLLILNGLLRSKTGWAHTDKAIVRLIRITFESQIPPTILAITFMIEFVQTPASLLGSTLQGIQSKLYTVGLMYSLNSRVSFRSANESGFNSVFAMTGRRDNATNDIHVDVETYVHHTQDIHSSDDDVRDKKNNEDVESLSDIHGHKSRGFDSQSHLTEPRHIA